VTIQEKINKSVGVLEKKAKLKPWTREKENLCLWPVKKGFFMGKAL